MRSGKVNSFPHLLREILDDVRQETALASSSSSSSSSSDAASKPNGEVNGSGVKKVNGTSGGAEEAQNGAGTAQTQGAEGSLAVPQAVIEEALKVTRESLEMVCEIEENGAT